MIIGTKLNTTPIALLNISLQAKDLQPADIADYEVRVISEDELRLIADEKLLTICITSNFEEYHTHLHRNIHFLGNTVYIYGVPHLNRGLTLEYYVATLQVASYWFNKGLSKTIISEWFEHISSTVRVFLTKMISYRNEIENIELSIHRLYNNRQKEFRYIDIKELEKACKKYKVSYARIEDTNELTFKKVRIGNENEGWINYKFIKLYLDDSLRLKRAVLGFNKFIYDSEWHLLTDTSFHPHINNRGKACFGNRDEDYSIYSSNYHYNFLVELLNETVRSYHPDNPYVNIVTLAGSLEVLKKKIISVISLASNKKNLDISDYLNYSESMLRNNVPTCPFCGGVLEELMPGRVDNESPSTCQNITCRASLKYEKLCVRCGEQLSAERWAWRCARYDWHCISTSCNQVTSAYRCRVCGQVLAQHMEDMRYYCNDADCGVHDIIQYDSDGRLVGGNETTLFNARAEWLESQESLVCNCGEPLEWDSVTRTFICSNRGEEEFNHDIYTLYEYAEMAGITDETNERSA